MPTLQEMLGTQPKRSVVIADTIKVIDEEVASRGGLTGMAIKGAYKLVKGFKPGFVDEVVDAMLDDFCKNLQPLVDEAAAQKTPITAHFSANSGRVAEALLAITDARARRSSHGAVKSAYEKLRGTAKKNVEEAVPRIGGLIQKHAA